MRTDVQVFLLEDQLLAVLEPLRESQGLRWLPFRTHTLLPSLYQGTVRRNSSRPTSHRLGNLLCDEKGKE